jgi:hypothetical protein
LVRIGSVPIEYDRMGSRPHRLGALELEYDRMGSRLRGIGDHAIDYDRLGSRRRTLGAWPLTTTGWDPASGGSVHTSSPTGSSATASRR